MRKARSKRDFLWFETTKTDAENRRSYYFARPRQAFVLRDPARLEDYFRHLEILRKQYYLAGFFSYELGYLLEDKLKAPKVSFPYAWFGVFEDMAVYDHKRGEYVRGARDARHGTRDRESISGAGYRISELRLSVGPKEYKAKIAQIKRHLRDGDIYQANYTLKYKFRFRGDPLALFRELKEKQRSSYNVFARLGPYRLLSTSPELFFAIEKGKMTVRPMKGTARRGRRWAEDLGLRAFLSQDEKNRAENLMIVDLLRNDLGRISRAGSVKTLKLFEVESYPTVHQMTSTVVSRLKPGLRVGDIVRAVFPSGSVTGAPKIRCMQILKGLEREERKIYTGALGFFTPDGDAKFNVAIRTVLLEGGRGEMGVGGGIVMDSRAEDEYAEARLKGSFLTAPARPPFKLIEAILYDNGYKRLEAHLARLRGSAAYFGFSFKRAGIRRELARLAAGLGKGRYKVRLLLDREGKVELGAERRPAGGGRLKVGITRRRTDSSDVFLYHKTTNRALYERGLAAAARKGLFDLLFFNERGELTEGARSNVYIEKGGRLYTPPVECGLLDGVVRRGLVEGGKAVEKVLKAPDLRKADKVYLSSAIMGLREAQLAIRNSPPTA